MLKHFRTPEPSWWHSPEHQKIEKQNKQIPRKILSWISVQLKKILQALEASSAEKSREPKACVCFQGKRKSPLLLKLCELKVPRDGNTVQSLGRNNLRVTTQEPQSPFSATNKAGEDSKGISPRSGCNCNCQKHCFAKQNCSKRSVGAGG